MQRIIPLILLMTMLSLLSGCQQQQEEISPQERAEIEAVGQEAARALMSNLKSALSGAMKEGGVDHAITACNIEAAPLTEETTENLRRVMQIKRTSLKTRNPQNAPDSLERAALQAFADSLEQRGQLPPYLLQKVAGDSEVTYRYYQPITVEAGCLACHGNPVTIPQPVQARLAALYPGDQAVGYKAGELRGVVRVSIRK